MLNANHESERASLRPPFRQLRGLRTYRIPGDLAGTLNDPRGGADARDSASSRGARGCSRTGCPSRSRSPIAPKAPRHARWWDRRRVRWLGRRGRKPPAPSAQGLQTSLDASQPSLQGCASTIEPSRAIRWGLAGAKQWAAVRRRETPVPFGEFRERARVAAALRASRRLDGSRRRRCSLRNRLRHLHDRHRL